MPEMSDLVSESIEKAARDAVANDGGLVTGFVALITYINRDGDRCWALSTGSEQGLPQSMGMADILTMTVRAQVEHAFLHYEEGD